ncbi:MAG: hypothetical protein JXR03_13315 [Cyclobacteriaceae bacterium]
MDELKMLWGQIRDDKELELLTQRKISESIRSKSTGTLSKLENKVKKRLYFSLLMVLALALSIPFIALISIQILLSILLAAYLIGGVLIFQEYRYLKQHTAMDQNLLAGIKEYQKRVKDILRFEEIVSLILYPISAVSGFLLGMFLLDPHTELLNEPKDWFLLIVPLIILTPISHFLNRKINNRSFREHLSSLDEDIKELEYGT